MRGDFGNGNEFWTTWWPHNEALNKQEFKNELMVYQNNTAINSHIATLESQIKAKQAEVAKHKEGSKKYRQAMADLEALQAAHQQYSRELLQNRNDLQELEQAIDDWHDKIRDMEIELRDLIHGAIMDRER